MTHGFSRQFAGITREKVTLDVQYALKAMTGRGKLGILFALFGGKTLRFNQLNRAIPTLTHKMLIQQLRDLETQGVLARVVYPVVPPKVEYSLTPAGEALCPALDQLALWTRDWKQQTDPTDSYGMSELESKNAPSDVG